MPTKGTTTALEAFVTKNVQFEREALSMPSIRLSFQCNAIARVWVYNLVKYFNGLPARIIRCPVDSNELPRHGPIP